MRMKHYLTNTDYGLWQVIMNGDEPVQTTRDENCVETKVPPKTTQAILARQRERKAKSIMLLAIPDEYQLRFHTIKDAKSLWAAIKSRFGGNVESKKMQKTVLKQKFENFFVSDTKGIDKAYDRFQKLISLLEVHGTTVSNEDANQKFLRALPSSWNNIALIMMNKEGIDELDIDDLYNNLKVFESDIKGSSVSSSNSQNMAFLSAEDTNSINEVNIANGVSTAAGHSSSGQASSSLYTDDLIRGHFARECRAPRNQGNMNGDARFKKGDGYHAVPPPLIENYMPPLADLSFIGLGDFVYRPIAHKASTSISKGEPSVIKTSNISVEMPKVYSMRTSGVIIKDWVSDDEDTLVDTQANSQTTVKPSFKKIEFTKARNESVKSNKQADKPKMVTQNSNADRKDWNGKHQLVLLREIGSLLLRPQQGNPQQAFSDSDYAGASLEKRPTRGGCQFLGSRLISWQCKKQTVVANSTTEAKYIAASHCCGQVLWIQNQMMDYGYNFMQTKIHVDNESAICVIKNPVYHSKTKHIEIRHQFFKDSYEKRLIEMVKIHTNNNVADLLTKAFDVSKFNFLVASIVNNGLKNRYHQTAKTDIWENSKEVRTLRYLSLVVPLKKVGDEAVHKELGDRMERAATTASSLEAE
uniref:Putative ribonuclease H-like domain-containing protein n=1 Tax=Tanacetum cinerariifolium TaxID=118510 RepID=A0A699HWR6_TANCI|nr:putative ribonuclease H-like domain-containing protein [Tanacetum cinerariifolium]